MHWLNCNLIIIIPYIISKGNKKLKKMFTAANFGGTLKVNHSSTSVFSLDNNVGMDIKQIILHYKISINFLFYNYRFWSKQYYFKSDKDSKTELSSLLIESH